MDMKIAMTRELAILNERLACEVRTAMDLLTREATSAHLGHNLSARAIEIESLNAKIAQTAMILQSMEAA
jgi:hypothetical protein